jgi:hypothetical protein
MQNGKKIASGRKISPCVNKANVPPWGINLQYGQAMVDVLRRYGIIYVWELIELLHIKT